MSVYWTNQLVKSNVEIMATPSTPPPIISSSFGTIISLTNGLQQGEYYMGPILPSVSPSPMKNIKEYIAKRVDSEQFVTMKILSLTPGGDQTEDYQGKLLVHNEHSILSLLQDQPGVVHHHGLFRESNNIILVLDCLHQHDYDSSGQYKDYINLQQHVIKEKRLQEREALQIFYLLGNTVKEIHKKNIVHRDLKLGNVVLNRRTNEVTLINFALGKHLVREDDLLSDQRGSLAYVSPDVLSGEPYPGKPSDMWSLGILLYTMIYGQFPFYDSIPQELFKKIKTGKFSLPRDHPVSMETTLLLRQLIELDPRKRLTAIAASDAVQSIISRLTFTLVREPVQIVPEIDSSQPTECIVPDQCIIGQHGTPTSSVNVIELTAPRLHLHPFIDLNNAHNTNRWIQATSPGGIVHSPMSPTMLPQFVFPDSPRSQLPNSGGGNPFLSSSPNNPSLLSLTFQASNSYSTTQSLPASLYTHHILPHSTNLLTDTIQEPHSTTWTPTDMSHPHLHPSSAIHRHSFSEGDPNNSIWIRRLLTGPSSSTVHGRRSLGSMLGGGHHGEVTRHGDARHRRNSHSYTLGLTDGPRARRRSHEPRDNEREILQSLRAVRRNSVNGRPHSAETSNS